MSDITAPPANPLASASSLEGSDLGWLAANKHEKSPSAQLRDSAAQMMTPITGSVHMRRSLANFLTTLSASGAN